MQAAKKNTKYKFEISSAESLDTYTAAHAYNTYTGEP